MAHLFNCTGSIAIAICVGCQSTPPPQPAPVEVVPHVAPVADAAAIPPEDSRPRCVKAGGTCVGPAAIAAHPSAPCADGMHRVDDVVIPGEGSAHSPACFGIPMGEEACCMK
jgi:hypothetical protein